MTATEKLRRLLDERGVEYGTDDAKTVKATRWKFGESGSAMFTEYDDEECAFVTSGCTWTPEQAIVATLGERTCHTVAMDCLGNPPFNQSRLHVNDTTCGCSECGAPWGKLSIFRGTAMEHNFVACPICGRKVVDE